MAGFADRLLTIVATATLTSAAWIIFGSGYLTREAEVSAEPPGVSPVPGASAVAEAPARPFVPGGGPLMVPVAGVAASQLTDTFSDLRAGGSRQHEALDIMAPAGTPVVAAGPGTVERLYRSEAGGNTIYLRSDDRATILYYAHLQDYAPGLGEGHKVAQGDVLGSVGSSGNANPDGPHLHFAILRTTPDAEWWEPATAINPYPLLARQ